MSAGVRRPKPAAKTVKPRGGWGEGLTLGEATTATMASDDCRKDELLDDSRADSGIDSFRSILKSEEARQPSADFGGERDKFSAVDERLDSAYGSSSITVESLTEIVGDCTLSGAAEQEKRISEQEENLLATITEDGDTYV